MTLRAAGYSDETLGGVWPENYIAKAGDIGALAGLAEPLPEYATKWMAAQLVYNVLERIEAANPPETPPAEGDANPEEAPANTDLSYVSGAFDSDLTTFAGKEFAAGMKVLTYGRKADYSKDMTLSETGADYLETTVYKYKSVETPAWYELDGNNKITRLILPQDVGYTGRAYGVINNIVYVTDGQGGEAPGFVTLSAGRIITWAGSSGLSTEENVPVKSDYNAGELFEFQLRNGQVTNVAAVDGSFQDKQWSRTPAGEIGSKDAFATVTSKTGNVVTVDPGDGNALVIEIKANAAVYFLDDDGSYSVGSVSSVREKSAVRLYDVSDDKEQSADAVIIKQ
jgi:hypothetical protein